jgi:catechol 2,3-dioxygenase-like lactoylglutathione lyase family enzyme
MSRLYTNFRQVAYVTRDLKKSIAFFTEKLGVGPWFVASHYQLKTCFYMGKPTKFDFSVGLANSGEIQFELIEQHDTVPSIYQDFLRVVPNGLHVQHLSTWSDDFPKSRAEAISRGFSEVQTGTSPSGIFTYLIHPDEPDFYLEMTDMNPVKERIFGAVYQAAVGWDGKDPIRMGFPGVS